MKNEMKTREEVIAYCDEINRGWLSGVGRIEPYLQPCDSFAEEHWRVQLTVDGVVYKHFVAGSLNGHAFRLFANGLKQAKEAGILEGKQDAVAALTGKLLEIVKLPQ